MDPQRVRTLLERQPKQVRCSIVVACHLTCGGEADSIVEVHRIERAESERGVEVGACLVGLDGVDVHPAQATEGSRAVRIERDRPL